MKFHKDYDVVMKPRAAATKRAKVSQLKRLVSFERNSMVKDTKRSKIEENDDNYEEDKELVPRITSRRISATLFDQPTLRRSSRDSTLRSGPQSYNAKWHPADDFKSPRLGGRSPFNTRAKTSSLSADLKPPKSHTMEASRERQDQKLARGDHASFQSYFVHEEGMAHLDRRCSSQETYNEDTTTKNDKSHYSSYNNFHRPNEVVKRLEKEWYSLALPLPLATQPVDKSADQREEPEEDSIKRSCHRCRKSRKGCDGHKLCGSCANAGINAEGYTNDDQTLPRTPVRERPARSSKKPELIEESQPKLTTRNAESAGSIKEQQVPAERSSPASNPSPVTPSRLLQKRLHESSSNIAPRPNVTKPSLKPRMLGWIRLRDFDRRLFLMQKGAPAKGDALPVQWSIIKQMLSEEGSGSSGSTEFIEVRCEAIRLGVEAFFAAEPETENKNDWKLSRVEGFDTFDRKRGLRYWKHLEDSIVNPIGTTLETASVEKQAKEDYFTDTQIDKFLAIAEPYQEVSPARDLCNRDQAWILP